MCPPGVDHVLIMKTNGSLWAMGSNGDGQLGNGGTETQHSPIQIVASDVAAVAAGNAFSLFLKSDGSLWGHGNKLDRPTGHQRYR